MLTNSFAKFIVIGLYSTAINYGIFFFLYKIIGINYVIASALGFITGVLAGYVFNKNWTFKAKKSCNSYIFKYYIVYLTSLILGLISLKLLVERLNFLPSVANFLVIILTTCTNYIGTKNWVFKK